MTKGILWVSSRVTQPDKLSNEAFCGWYEDTHIPDVLSLPGIPSATRYEAIEPQPSQDTWSSEAPWLTVYEMPDINYRNTVEFKALDGQSEPEESLLEGIFNKSRFDTRFYEQVQHFECEAKDKKPERRGDEEQGQGGGAKRFLISAALEPRKGEDDDFDDWYRNEHIPILNRAPGFLRSRRYVLVNGTTLHEFERSEPEVPKYLALHEFEGDVLPWKELGESAETKWAKKVMGGLAKSEVGWYVGKREYM